MNSLLTRSTATVSAHKMTRQLPAKLDETIQRQVQGAVASAADRRLCRRQADREAYQIFFRQKQPTRVPIFDSHWYDKGFPFCSNIVGESPVTSSHDSPSRTLTEWSTARRESDGQRPARGQGQKVLARNPARHLIFVRSLSAGIACRSKKVRRVPHYSFAESLLMTFIMLRFARWWVLVTTEGWFSSHTAAAVIHEPHICRCSFERM